MKTECGLIGAFINNPISKKDLWNTLAEIQHRGQDSYGFVSIHSNGVSKIKKEKGLLPDLDSLDLPDVSGGVSVEDKDVGADGASTNGTRKGDAVLFLGHMRYSTNTSVEKLDESLTDCNIQPVEISEQYGIYLAHNGNLPNMRENMQKLGLGQYYKNGMSDTYLFRVIWNVKFAGRFNSGGGKTCKIEDVLEYLKYIILNVVGAYSCVMTFCESRGDSNTTARTSVSSIGSDTSGGAYSDSSDSDDSDNGPRYYLIGFRDRYGYKPLSIGKLVDDVSSSSKLVNHCFFSESVQLQDNKNNKHFIGDVGPGEIWCSIMNKAPRLIGRISDSGKKRLIGNNINVASGNGDSNLTGFLCSLEAIYFMKKESVLFNGETTVNNFRRRLGIELAKQDIHNYACALNPNDMNPSEYEARQLLKRRVILYMPESSYSIAQGYAEMLDTWTRGDLITKVQNIRSFIENSTEAREGKLKRKFAFDDAGIAALGDSEIILVDDTIVRGNSMRYVIGELYKRNPALKIHVRIGSPRLLKGCSFGIDLYDDELIATKEDNLAGWLGIASVEFLELSKLKEIFARYGMLNCQYCFGVNHKYNQKTLEW